MRPIARAKVIHAEGEYEASTKLAEAATAARVNEFETTGHGI